MFCATNDSVKLQFFIKIQKYLRVSTNAFLIICICTHITFFEQLLKYFKKSFFCKTDNW